MSPETADLLPRVFLLPLLASPSLFADGQRRLEHFEARSQSTNINRSFGKGEGAGGEGLASIDPEGDLRDSPGSRSEFLRREQRFLKSLVDCKNKIAEERLQKERKKMGEKVYCTYISIGSNS